MKRVWLTLFLLCVAAGASCAGHGERYAVGESDAPRNERDEIKQSYRLKPGAVIEVAGIRGTVEVEAIDGDTAHIEVVRSSSSREALADTKIVIEQTPTSLVVRSENESDNFVMHWLRRGRTANYSESVKLKVPRQVDLLTRGVNGRVTLGAVNGKVHVTGVNGSVAIVQAAGTATVSGVNGRVTLGLRSIGDQGANVSGVNGPVEIRFAGGVNADVQASGINGRVDSSDPGVTVDQDEDNRSSFHARVGAGGAPISLSGINRPVSLRRNTAG
ncbi:MAG: hypothetical protein WKF30_11890 [Pyrinomonadaceae bacterium]